MDAQRTDVARTCTHLHLDSPNSNKQKHRVSMVMASSVSLGLLARINLYLWYRPILELSKGTSLPFAPQHTCTEPNSEAPESE